MMVHHVFPYDPGHLGISLDKWWMGQLQRWPLAAVAATSHARETVVHVIGRRTRLVRSGVMTLQVHGTAYNNSRHHQWGDDWSASLGRRLRRVGHDDIVVIHMEAYASARLTMRASRNARTILVLHGRGSGSDDDYSAVDEIVALHDDAAKEVLAAGVAPTIVTRMVPSVDKKIFYPSDEQRQHPEAVFGYVGRLEESKGAFELGGVLRELNDYHPRLECVGSAPRTSDLTRARESFGKLAIEIRGELAITEVAAVMRRWDALLVPSYTEGMSLVVLEALSCHVPVVAVEGVHASSISQRPGMFVRPRARLSDGAREALGADRNWTTDWIPSHSDAARQWDELYDSLGSWRPRRVPSWRPSLGRLKRFRLRHDQ